MIWGSQKKIIIFPAILMLSTAVIGFTASKFNYDETIPFILGTVTNLVLMALTAGRIWWMRREASYLGVVDMLKTRYNTVIAIMQVLERAEEKYSSDFSLESGVLYCICAAAAIISVSIDGGSNIGHAISIGIAEQAVNIVPTLVVVRVVLGHNTHDDANQRREDNPLAIRQRTFPPRHSTLGILDIKQVAMEEV
ncbi:hypothetical protein GGX14DRAFT_11512 [Mycena pura]|uniref:Uncharacterized protein n=1 Tax=Mycena pura TaxID=153505 RepID=A0AAD6VWU2_9AGAR|nr:hypothetical protein GGX14DRAFT_11512 [Mycena pura]